MDSSSIVLAGFIASTCASVGTALGSLGVFFIQSLSRRLEDGLLSLAAGIMLAATGRKQKQRGATGGNGHGAESQATGTDS